MPNQTFFNAYESNLFEHFTQAPEIDCAASYNTEDPSVKPQYICPENQPNCVGYQGGNVWGTCVDSKPTPTETIQGLEEDVQNIKKYVGQIGETITNSTDFTNFSSSKNQILARIYIPNGRWLINFSMTVKNINKGVTVVRVQEGSTIAKPPSGLKYLKSTQFLYSTQFGPLTNSSDQSNLQGTFVYNQSSTNTKPVILYGQKSSATFVGNSKNIFTATRIA